MTAKNLFKRFVKESGFYGSIESKESLQFIDKYSEMIMPLNSFVWDTTKQGHNYWYEKALNWVVFLYENLAKIDENEKSLYHLDDYCILNTLYDLLEDYYLEGSTIDELMKNESYAKAVNLYRKKYPYYETRLKSISTVSL